MKYKYSKFNIEVPLNKFNIAIYNTLYDSAVLIEKSILWNIKTGKINNECIDTLIDEKILIDKLFNEDYYFKYIINKLKYSPTNVSFTLLLTNDCNYKCKYCFEGFNQKSIYMSDSTAIEFTKYLECTIRKHPSVKKAMIIFYGGEPLLNKQRMKLICDYIISNTFLRSKCEFSITTNLFLLSKDVIDIFRNYKFKSIQIALDGPEKIHDKRRITKEGHKTFDKTIKNIKILLDNNLPVVIILNYDKQNFKYLFELIFEIKLRLDYAKITFFLNPITQTKNNKGCNEYFMSEKEEVKFFLNLHKYVRKEGLNSQPFGQRDMLCMATKDISSVITPDGKLFKCGLMMNIHEESYGSIFNYNYNRNNYKFITDQSWENCLKDSCVYLPICGGGCKGVNFIKGIEMSKVSCDKHTYYDVVYIYLLREHLEELYHLNKTR